MNKKILVTGGGGYIGSVSTYLLLKKGFEVVAVDNFSTGYKSPLKFFTEKFPQNQFRYYETDLMNSEPASRNLTLQEIFKKEKNIEAILHYAASCQVNESMENPGKYFSNNVISSYNLLSAAVNADIKNIIFSSTCAVYGEAKYVPIDEKHPTNPENPYGESKRMIEKMIEWYGKLLGLNYVILRYFNVCGASDDGKIGDSKKPSSLLVQNAVRGALGIDKFYLTCPKVDTPDGTPIRDYINVVDLNEAHIKALEYLFKGGRNEIINLGTGTGNSVLEIVEKVQNITEVTFKYEITTLRLGEYGTMIANTKKAQKILGWKPARTIEDSVKSLILWYKTHPEGWDI